MQYLNFFIGASEAFGTHKRTWKPSEQSTEATRTVTPGVCYAVTEKISRCDRVILAP